MKKLSKSLFLVSTASQAFFLSHTPHLVNNAVLVITVRTKGEASRIMSHVEKLQWKRVHIWYIPKGTRTSAYLKLLMIRLKIMRLKWTHSTFDSVYIGSYVNLVHLSVLAEYENHSKLFLLYDGLQMVVNNADRNQQDVENVMQFPKFYSFLGFKRPAIEAITFVTPLPLKVKKLDSIHLISSTTTLETKPSCKNTIYFVGQPLAIFGIVSTEFYLDCLRSIRNKYPEHEIIYFPHPREDESILSEISRIFRIEEQDQVFEEYYLNLKKVPGKVISFYSSVLINLFYFKSMSELISVEISKEDISIEKFRKHIAMVYTYFNDNAGNNFRVVTPKNL